MVSFTTLLLAIIDLFSMFECTQSSSASTSSVSISTTSTRVSSTSGSTAAAAVATSFLLCPGSDGASVSTPKGAFRVQCFIGRYRNDLGFDYTSSLDECVQLCGKMDRCVEVSWTPAHVGFCFFKSGQRPEKSNDGGWGARLLELPAPPAI